MLSDLDPTPNHEQPVGEAAVQASSSPSWGGVVPVQGPSKAVARPVSQRTMGCYGVGSYPTGGNAPPLASPYSSTVPEGHTIHRLARDHARFFRGQRLSVSSPQGRFADSARLLDGSVLEAADAYGKHLFLRFEGKRFVHVHLGLFGKLRIGPLPAPEPRGALRLRLIGDEAYSDLRGPTVCALLTPDERRAVFARLGPDPLRRDADPARAYARLARSRQPIAQLLMDQTVLAGVGNVYRAELLFLHELDPFLPGASVGEERWELIWADLKDRMQAGVRANRIVTTRPEHRSRATGRVLRADASYVYRRAGDPCRICRSEVRSQLLAGRTLYWCPTCQPPA